MGSFKSPKDTFNEISNIGGNKHNLSLASFIILGFLAGVYIAFGGMLSEVVTTGLNCPIGLKKFLFGALFPLGLILIVLCGAELFTGSCLYLNVAVLDKKSNLKTLTKILAETWFFNFIGALFVAFFFAYLGGILVSEPFSTTAITVANNKIFGLTWVEALIRGIGCNWLVCLAIFIAVSSEDVISKILGIWFPIMAFVVLGFEHSVANMFFIPLGMMLGSPISITQLFFNNLIPVTIGNIIGGAFFVGCLYWIVYLKK